LRLDGVVAKVEDAATQWVKGHLATFAAEIKNSTGATRDAYRKVQEQTTEPEAITIELRSNEKAATKFGSGEHAGDDLPTFDGHLYADAEGRFPAQLNDWEAHVLATELARPSFVAWYRNPARPTPNALRIAYRDDAGAWRSLQVDFIFVSKRDDGSLGAAIVDPHGDQYADARAKLHALAAFAEDHGHRFVRILSIAKAGDGTYRSLDLLEPAVRESVRSFAGAKVSALYDADPAVPYL
jgi:hypothetical protein